LALAAFCIASALIFHRNFGDQMQMIMFMKNFAMAGGLLMLYVHGAGGFSVDAKRA
jgi:putative oxidoreductase